MENKIRKYGVGAEHLARDMISQWGIRDVTDAQFEQMLKGKPMTHRESNYENYKINQRQEKPY